jgi:hypothetical protein
MAMIKVYRYEFLNPMIGKRSKATCLGIKEHSKSRGMGSSGRRDRGRYIKDRRVWQDQRGIIIGARNPRSHRLIILSSTPGYVLEHKGRRRLQKTGSPDPSLTGDFSQL